VRRLTAAWPRLRVRLKYLHVLVVVAFPSVAVLESWRAALLALVAAGTVAATGFRFAGHFGAAVLAAALLLALTGNGATSDHRRPIGNGRPAKLGERSGSPRRGHRARARNIANCGGRRRAASCVDHGRDGVRGEPRASRARSG
jgi:hypothetical protein